MILHSGDVSGPLRTLLALIDQLAASGEVEVLVPWRGTATTLMPARSRVSELGVGRLVMPRDAGEWLAALRAVGRDLRRVRRVIRRARPEVVLVSSSTMLVALAAARLEGVPTVVYIGELFAWRGPRGPLRSVLGRLVVCCAAALADASICPSRAAASQLPAWLARRAATIHPPIAAGPRRSGDSFREAHGIPPDAMCLLHVGSISRGRGQDLGVRALAELSRDLPHAVCAFVGVSHSWRDERAYRLEVERLAENLGVADRVRWCGFVADMAAAYAASDVVINPVRIEEAFGRAGMEALAAGRPLVASRIGGIAEMLHDQREALLVGPGDATALAAAILRIARDPALARTMVENGRRRVHECCDPEERLDLYSAVLSRALR